MTAAVRVAERTRVELRFSRLQSLRGADGRRAAADPQEVALEARSP